MATREVPQQDQSWWDAFHEYREHTDELVFKAFCVGFVALIVLSFLHVIPAVGHMFGSALFVTGVIEAAFGITLYFVVRDLQRKNNG